MRSHPGLDVANVLPRAAGSPRMPGPLLVVLALALLFVVIGRIALTVVLAPRGCRMVRMVMVVGMVRMRMGMGMMVGGGRRVGPVVGRIQGHNLPTLDGRWPQRC